MNAGFSDSGEADTRSILDAGGNLGVDRFLLDHTAFTAAIGAGIADHATRAVTRGACARNAEKSLLVSDLSAPAAAAATGGSFALRAPRAVTLFAKLMLSVDNLFFYAEGCFFEFDGNVFPQIGATLSAGASAGTISAEEVAESEKFAEDITEILEDRCVESAAGAPAPTPAWPKRSYISRFSESASTA